MQKQLLRMHHKGTSCHAARQVYCMHNIMFSNSDIESIQSESTPPMRLRVPKRKLMPEKMLAFLVTGVQEELKAIQSSTGFSSMYTRGVTLVEKYEKGNS